MGGGVDLAGCKNRRCVLLLFDVRAGTRCPFPCCCTAPAVTSMCRCRWRCRAGLRPHQRLVLIEQYGAATFMVPECECYSV